MENETLMNLVLWLAAGLDPLVVAGIPVGILVMLQVAKAVPWFQDQVKAFPLAAAAMGLAAGLVGLECSLRGGLVGMLLGALAAGGYDVLKALIRPASTDDDGAAPGLYLSGRIPPSAKTGLVLVLALLLPLAAIGCQAPAEVRGGQAFEAAIIAQSIDNNRRIADACLTVYGIERAAAVDASTRRAITLIRDAQEAAANDGPPLTPAALEAALLALVQERDKAAADTATVKSRLKGLFDANELETRKALRLHGAISEYLDAGLDASAVPALASEAIHLISALRGQAAVPLLPTTAPSASTSTP